MSEPRHVYGPTNHHQQEIQEGRIQRLATDPSGWADGVPWYLTTIHRVKLMAAGVARIIPFLANSGTPTAIGINRPGSRGSSGDSAAIDHEHGTPDYASTSAGGWMSTAHVSTLNAANAHRQVIGNPHDTQIGDIPNLSSTLSAKADLVGGKIPSSQLPSFVDDVEEYANRAAFPTTGESGKIYLALDDNHQWRWSGSTYIDITSESGNEYNRGVPLYGTDPFTSRASFDGRGGVRTATGMGPFGLYWYNMVDVRHRNVWNAPGDIWGGELVWGMTGVQNRMAFRSRAGDGTPTAWTEVSVAGHGHAISDVANLQAELNNKLPRIPVNISNGDANAILVNGIFSGYSVGNAPNPSWGILRVYHAPGDDGDQVWQTWTSAAYATNQEYRRSSYNYGVTWTPWQTHKEIDGLGQMRSLYWPSLASSSWYKIGTLRVTERHGSAVFSGIFVSGGGAVSWSDNGSYLVTARLKQQDPMTSPAHIIELSWSLLTGISSCNFGYVVSTDNASEKVVTIYGYRHDGYTGTNAAIFTTSGFVNHFPGEVTGTEPPGIVYLKRSISAPVQRRIFTIGDGSTTLFTLTHGLGSKGVRVTVRKASAPYNMVECIDELDASDPTNKVVVGFYGYTPAPNEFEVTVMV